MADLVSYEICITHNIGSGRLKHPCRGNLEYASSGLLGCHGNLSLSQGISGPMQQGGHILDPAFCSGQGYLQMEEIDVPLSWIDHYLVSFRLAGPSNLRREVSLLERPTFVDAWNQNGFLNALGNFHYNHYSLLVLPLK